jgi:restriction endonuclease
MFALYGFLNPMDSCPIYSVEFRQGRNTLDTIVRFETFIRNAFAKNENAVPIFFDIEKAYDTTWKYVNLKDLFDIELKGRLINCISNFLSEREFNVRVISTYSDIHEQEMGVHQGTILSVTLISIKINSLAKVLNDSMECSLYVDDFLLCYWRKNMNIIERQIQLCLNKIEKWAMENGFKFSRSNL